MTTDERTIMASTGVSAAACNVCGSTDFKPGPGGRLVGDRAPTCAGCGSLERHRIYRSILAELIGHGEASDFKALQFSRDPSIEPAWFQSLTHSVYGHQNSIDIQAIELPNGSYDIVICNHIIEHVADDRAAFREVSRILTDRGFAFVSVPNPAERENTSDWGYPNWDQHGHYRVYGKDVADRIAEAVPNMWVAAVEAVDPVTGRHDMGFVLSRGRSWYDRALKSGLQARSVNSPD